MAISRYGEFVPYKQVSWIETRMITGYGWRIKSRAIRFIRVINNLSIVTGFAGRFCPPGHCLLIIFWVLIFGIDGLHVLFFPAPGIHHVHQTIFCLYHRGIKNTGWWVNLRLPCIPCFPSFVTATFNGVRGPLPFFQVESGSRWLYTSSWQPSFSVTASKHQNCY